MQTVDVGFLLAGSYDSQPIGWTHGFYISPFLFKTDSFGNVQWNQTFGNIEDYHEGQSSSLIATKDGGNAVMGSLDNAIWLAKFAPESNTSPDGSETIPVSWIVVILIIAVVIIVVGLGLVLYLTKRK